MADKLRKGIDQIKSNTLEGKNKFDRYANLKDFYKVEVNDDVNEVYDNYGNYVASYYPKTGEFNAHEYYDEVEPKQQETKDYYTRRMTALGYKPHEIEGVIKSYKW